MRTSRSLLAIVAMILSVSVSALQAEETLTYAALLGRMTDVSQLAVLPVPGETCAQWSSWDRASKYDEATGVYVGWDANGDNAGCIRMEGKQLVMAEMTGPGCIWRIWSACALKGHVKIYVDDQETPVVDLPFDEFFTGHSAPFNYATLAYNLGQTIKLSWMQDAIAYNGQNLYMPIPYQKSCKIVADEGWGAYYHFTYSTFPKGTTLPTFSDALIAENAPALKKVDDFFRDRLGENPIGSRPGQESLIKKLALAPGQKVCVADLAGPRAITALKVKTAFVDRQDQMTGLRKTVLQITWDGQTQPAVWCPLGDFFGTAPGENHYKSLMTGMTPDGYYAYWYMPFGKHAAVELVNEDEISRNVEIEIVHAPLDRPFEGLGHFHAKWHRDTTALPKDRFPDWIMLQAQGRGRFCGVMLHVWNPRGGWWGEGDEKFFVDGEKFPSTFGTGSEDYFGYAWCHPALFQRPYHCQTMTENNQGHQSVLRWHIADNVPFQKSFEGCIEKYDHPGPDVRYACTACWYLSPDGVDAYAPAPATERDGYYVVLPRVVTGIEVLGQVPGSVTDQGMHGFGEGKWQDNNQLWWTGAGPGAKLNLRLPVQEAGKHRLDLALTKAPDYAIVQFHLDGQKIGEPIDLYNSDGVVVTQVSLGVHEFTAGDHTLTVEIVGANEKAIKSHMFGLDIVTCEPVKP
jgi:hypothetical protein